MVGFGMPSNSATPPLAMLTLLWFAITSIVADMSATSVCGSTLVGEPVV